MSMPSSISFWGREIPLYGICFWIGVAVSVSILFSLCTQRKIRWYDMAYSAVFAMIGAMIGAKGLFILVSWKDIIEAGIPFVNVLKGGFVFYGGLIGGAFGLWLYVRIYRLKIIDFTDIYALALPIGHAIGRVGCFFAGCCYGIPYDGSFSHTYTETIGQTPLNTPLLPIQLIEAGCLVLLFAVNLLLYRFHPLRQARPTWIYLCAYAVIRFTLEFWRGDRERGILGGLSTAQWVSIALLLGLAVTGLIMLVWQKSIGRSPRKKNRE